MKFLFCDFLGLRNDNLEFHDFPVNNLCAILSDLLSSGLSFLFSTHDPQVKIFLKFCPIRVQEYM